MADHGTAIQAFGVWKRLGGRVILRDVSLSVPWGTIVAVVGTNGSGKTTLLRCLASLLKPCAGHVCWMDEQQLTTQRLRRAIGYAGHDTFLYPHLTAEENLLFAARMQGVVAPAERVRRLLGSTGLDVLRSAVTSRLSAGMRRRLSILRAIVHAPPIVLLDEPSTGLDAQGQHWLACQLRQMRHERRCVCFVTHDAAQVNQLADRVLELHAGGVEQRVDGDGALPSDSPAGRRAA